MTSPNLQQEKSLTAFITALSQQDESLPDSLRAQLQAIGQNLENRAMELPAIAASLPRLNQAYQQALTATQTDVDKSAAFVSSPSQDPGDALRDRAAKIFTDPDPVQAAQKSQTRGLRQVASNPLKRFFGRG
ncbi:hypothetical protein IQ241_16040 [Romeria aff. gracilis LEGE 07310]|uniref:Uncharacterized protein n=1 Tax=Vasconcelosia minhoensis LEGE 07310 TaxID=915328 RepID=A0A8J7AQJ3_9CYAN|nr:hypothetical protein [Romeria gracilis]MBE9078789.1 hypothetical protein [Romeria aff. gracilis LEGE 07310]